MRFESYFNVPAASKRDDSTTLGQKIYLQKKEGSQSSSEGPPPPPSTRTLPLGYSATTVHVYAVYFSTVFELHGNTRRSRSLLYNGNVDCFNFYTPYTNVNNNRPECNKMHNCQKKNLKKLLGGAYSLPYPIPLPSASLAPRTRRSVLFHLRLEQCFSITVLEPPMHHILLYSSYHLRRRRQFCP